MNLINNILLCTLLLNASIIHALKPGAKKTTTTSSRSTRTRQPVKKPTRAQKTLARQQTPSADSYINALNIIRNNMTSDFVIKNNVLTQEFINFVTKINLSAIETKALLEAGVNLHATWSNDNEITKNRLIEFNKTIQSIVPTQQPKPAQPTSPRNIPSLPAQQPAKFERKITGSSQLSAATHQFATNNLIMLLDPKKDDAHQTVGAMTSQLIIALLEKAAPIITSSNILETVIKAKQQVGDQNLQKLKTTKPHQLQDQAEFLLSSRNVSSLNSTLLMFLSGIDFDRKNFNFYFHKTTQLVLIIPKQYIQTNSPKAMNFDLHEQARVCGFNPTAMIALTDLSSQNLIQQLTTQQTKPLNQEKFITDLMAMFIAQKKHGELISPEHESKWCIYLNGHGMPAYLSVGSIRKQLDSFKMATAPRKKNQRYVVQISPQARIKMQEYEKMMHGKELWPDSQMIPESASIAGINAGDFKQLMKFFDSNLDVAYLHYITCFAGGSNQSFVNETLSLFDVNFIVSAAGIHEGITSSSYKPKYSPEIPHIRVEYPSFNEFFTLLRLYFTNPEEFIKIAGYDKDLVRVVKKGKKTVTFAKKEKDPIIRIIRTVTPAAIQHSQPFVRFPSVGAFTATPITQSTKILTKAFVRAHEIEEQPIDFSNTKIDTLIINAPRIDVSLNLGRKKGVYHAALVAPSPKDIVPTYEALRIFKDINVQDSLQSFIFNCVRLNAHFYPQTFVVKDLKGIAYEQSGINAPNNSVIHNLIIQMYGIAGSNNAGTEHPTLLFAPLKSNDVRTSRLGMNVYVAFEIGDTIYSTMFAIKNFENEKGLYKNMEKIRFTATPKRTINMNELAKNFLTQKDIAKIVKPITLQSLTEIIDTKLNEQDASMAIQSDADNEALRAFAQERAQSKGKKR